MMMMADFTPLLRPIFERSRRRAMRSHEDLRATQTAVLRRLLLRAEKTAYGRAIGLRRDMEPQRYAATAPAAGYPAMRPYVMRMVAGEADVLWPGRCRRFAQSSGTSDGKSKYVPVTDDSLRLNHYHGGSLAVAHYLHSNPLSRLFSGKTFILGGSFANEVASLPAGVKVGDLSAHLIERINRAVELMRVPRRSTALLEDWREKLPRLVEESSRADVTSISGVPSWFLTVLREVMASRGAATIHEVWPRLEVFFHGGISFEPYRAQYAALADPARMHYLETYNASEGFFAVQDYPGAPGMMLMADDGIYYEFIPLACSREENPPALPAWEVREGETYELVITAPNGLWRYRPGDTVRVVTASPLRIAVAGRTRQYINAFGEELMVHNAEEAMAQACARTGARVADYTAAPVYASGASKGHHRWLVEYSVEPESVEAFAAELDSALCRCNSDYQAKRAGGIFLAPPVVEVAPRGLFDAWLASTGKLGGQRKVPRLCPDDRCMAPLLALRSKLSGTDGSYH